MTKLKKENIKQYYSSIGVLLTELIIFSTPLRFPVLLFLQQLQYFRSLKPAAVVSFFVIIYIFFTDLTRETMLLAALMIGSFGLASAKNNNTNISEVSTQILVFLLAISFLQVTTSFSFGSLFSNYLDKFPDRASGLSAEPSFFAWVFIYFWISRYCGKGLDIFSYISIFIAIILTQTITLVAFLLVFSVTCILMKLIKSKISALFILIFFYHAIPLLLLYLQIPVFDILYTQSGTWREPSHFASIASSKLIGPFSAGFEWNDALRNGISEIFLELNPNWIIWPWSFSSVLFLEFGFLIGLSICLLLIWICSKHGINSYRHKVGWVLLLFISLVLAPKWMIFFFFLPLYGNTNK